MIYIKCFKGKGSYNLILIQDFSQCHGFVQANVKNMLPNEIAVFSTMYRKSQSSGGSGGFITTNCDHKGNLIRSLSDRGKIRSSLITGITKQEQLKIARLVKIGRELALLPYVTTSSYKQSYNRR